MKVTEAELERLTKLAEECAEVVQVVAKIIKWGYDHRKPDTLESNRYRLEEEIADVQNAVRLLLKSGDVDIHVITDIQWKKVEHVNKHLLFNQL